MDNYLHRPSKKQDSDLAKPKNLSIANKDKIMLYYKPNAWFQNLNVNWCSRVEIFGSFTNPPWSVYAKCHFSAKRQLWCFVMEKPADVTIKFKFRVDEQHIDTSALHYQYTDEHGNYNNIMSPWDHIMDPSIFPKLNKKEYLMMIEGKIHSAVNHLRMAMKYEGKPQSRPAQNMKAKPSQLVEDYSNSIKVICNEVFGHKIDKNDKNKLFGLFENNMCFLTDIVHLLPISKQLDLRFKDQKTQRLLTLILILSVASEYISNTQTNGDQSVLMQSMCSEDGSIFDLTFNSNQCSPRDKLQDQMDSITEESEFESIFDEYDKDSEITSVFDYVSQKYELNSPICSTRASHKTNQEVNQINQAQHQIELMDGQLTRLKQTNMQQSMLISNLKKDNQDLQNQMVRMTKVVIQSKNEAMKQVEKKQTKINELANALDHAIQSSLKIAQSLRKITKEHEQVQKSLRLEKDQNSELKIEIGQLHEQMKKFKRQEQEQKSEFKIEIGLLHEKIKQLNQQHGFAMKSIQDEFKKSLKEESEKMQTKTKHQIQQQEDQIEAMTNKQFNFQNIDEGLNDTENNQSDLNTAIISHQNFSFLNDVPLSFSGNEDYQTFSQKGQINVENIEILQENTDLIQENANLLSFLDKNPIDSPKSVQVASPRNQSFQCVSKQQLLDKEITQQLNNIKVELQINRLMPLTSMFKESMEANNQILNQSKIYDYIESNRKTPSQSKINDYFESNCQMPSQPKINDYCESNSQMPSQPKINDYFESNCQMPSQSKINDYFESNSQMPSQPKINDYCESNSQMPSQSTQREELEINYSTPNRSMKNDQVEQNIQIPCKSPEHREDQEANNSISNQKTLKENTKQLLANFNQFFSQPKLQYSLKAI